LAIEVASRTSEHFPDGAWLVDLAPIRETDLVARTIASALDVGISPDRAPIDALSEFVAARHLMVILDNCEHLLDPVASMVNELLSRSAQLVVLVTSREPLRTEGEVVWRVPVLSLPAEAAVGDLQEALTSDAVRLFVDRALSARRELCIDEADAQALAGVVRRLDGLPLAIELAATRLGVRGQAGLPSQGRHRARSVPLVDLVIMNHPVGGPLGNSRDSERRVDSQGPGDDRPVGHIEPRMVPNLASVVHHAQLRRVAHDATAQGMSRQ
jgi:predicted ATPase